MREELLGVERALIKDWPRIRVKERNYCLTCI